MCLVIPGLPLWILYAIAAFCVGGGLILVLLGKNPFPVGRRFPSRLSARLQGAAGVVLGACCAWLASDGTVPLSATRLPDWSFSVILAIGSLIYGGLLFAGWLVYRKATHPPASD